MKDVSDLISAIDKAEQLTLAGDQGQLIRERALALDYYYGRNLEPAAEGRSQVVDRTLFETVQWILPSLCRIFANGDNVVEFAPGGPQDEQAAQQQSDYLNYLVTQRNPWFQTFLAWAQDALLMKNGYCMPYIDEQIQIETETYKRQSIDAAAALTMDNEIVDVEQAEPDDQTGEPLVNVTVRQKKSTRQLRFEVLAPERCKVDMNHIAPSLAECRYFEYADFAPISQLRQDGYEVDDDISDAGERENEADYSRNLYQFRGKETSEYADPSMRLVLVRHIWIRYDMDDDGMGELIKTTRIGSEILKRDGEYDITQTNRIPVACIVPTLNPHRHVGTSIADMVIDVQRIKQAILRAGLDSLYRSVSPRLLVSEKVNLDDLNVQAPGFHVRLHEGALPGEGHVLPLVDAPVFDQAMTGLDYMDSVAERRSGVSRMSAGIDLDVQNKSPQSGVAINQLSTMASQHVEQIARLMASGVEELFSIAHELVLKSGPKQEILKLRGQWVLVDPSTWKTNREMRVVVGYAAGNKDALIQRLGAVVNSQYTALQAGLPIVQPQNLYESHVELAKAADFSAPQRFYTDPKTLPPAPPPPPSDNQVFAAVEAQKMQSAERLKQMDVWQREQESKREAAVKIQLEQMKEAQSHAQQKTDRQHDVAMKYLDHASEIAQQSPDVNVKAHLDQSMQQLHGAIGAIHDSIAGVSQQLNAPRAIVRDKNGRATGVMINGIERKVIRGSDGKVTGLE